MIKAAVATFFVLLIAPAEILGNDPREGLIIDLTHIVRSLQNHPDGQFGELLVSLEDSPTQSELESMKTAIWKGLGCHSPDIVLENLGKCALFVGKPSDYYKLGAEVYAPSHSYSSRKGYIKSINRGGSAVVRFDSLFWGQTGIFLLRELAVVAGCLEDDRFCIGDRIYTGSGHGPFIVAAIDYYNGRIGMSMPGGFVYRLPDRLLTEQGCLKTHGGEDICVGDNLENFPFFNKYPTSPFDTVRAVGRDRVLIEYFDAQEFPPLTRRIVRLDQLSVPEPSNGEPSPQN